MNDDWTGSRERSAFGALVVLILAPIVAQGLWRPLGHVLGTTGSAGAITGAALAIGGATVLVHRLRPRKAQLLALGSGVLVAIGACAGLALGRAGLLTLLSVAVAMAFLVRRLFPQLPASLDGLATRHKVLTALYLVVALASLISTTRVSIFMGDPARGDQQAVPGESFLETHSCLTAYVHASTLSRQHVDNLYAESFWQGADGRPARSGGADNPYRPFLLDYYAYPPPFLLVMAPLVPLDGDYTAQRALWFGLNGLLLAVGLWIVARWLDGPGTHRVLLLAPIFFASLPVLVTLQVGNFQIAVVMISILAMVAFQRERAALGGALLAFAILSKISPGVLGVLLLAQRRFRAAAWTAGFGVLLLILSVLVFGKNPLWSFLTYTLPRLSSGEALAFLDDTPFSIITNMAPFGLPFKLRLAGLEVGEPWAVARQVGRVYTFVLLFVAVVAALRRPADRRDQALVWMSLLGLAALQSPFAPGYTLMALLWALTLLTMEVRTLRAGVALVLLWVGLAILPPWRNQSVLVAQSLLQSTLAVGVPIWLILRAARTPRSFSPA